MTDHAPDPHQSVPATGPLALKSNLVLGHDALKWSDDEQSQILRYTTYCVDLAVSAERARIAEAMRNLVRVLHLPDAPQYPGDERHTEKRMLLALADATVADSWPNVAIKPRRQASA